MEEEKLTQEDWLQFKKQVEATIKEASKMLFLNRELLKLANARIDKPTKPAYAG